MSTFGKYVAFARMATVQAARGRGELVARMVFVDGVLDKCLNPGEDSETLRREAFGR
jgi:hypothetical protein